MGIVLSADSTCDIGDELKQRFDVHFYPYHINYRGQDYQDNVDITPDVMFAGYYEDGSLPKTSAINVQEYIDYFTPFLEAGHQVVHLNLGAALSSAHQNALLAAEQLPGVYPIDSQTLSTGIALQVMEAGRLIQAGKSVEEVVASVKEMRSRTHASFVLRTMDFLAAGGRCPSILAHVGKALQFHPEILVNNADGSMSMGKLYRGKQLKALRKYVQDTLSRYDDIVLEDIFITHSGIEDEYVEQVRSQLLEALPFQNIHVTQASCTISSHCGPGTLGILFVTETPSR